MKKLICFLCILITLFTTSIIVTAKNVTIYNENGDSKIIDSKLLDAWIQLGWSTKASTTTMYTMDGRSKVVENSKVEAYKNVGWYSTLDEVQVTMYAPDGRTKKVFKGKTGEYKKVGWYTEPVTTMYAIDGRSKVVENSKVDAYKKVGWYSTLDEVQVTMYAPDGRTKKVFKGNIEKEKAVGWSTDPKTIYTHLYSADGRVKRFLKSDTSSIDANIKVGWSKTPSSFPFKYGNPGYKLGGGVLFISNIADTSSSAHLLTNRIESQIDSIRIVYIESGATNFDTDCISSYNTNSSAENIQRIELPDTLKTFQTNPSHLGKNLRIGIPSSVTNFCSATSDFIKTTTLSIPKSTTIYCEPDSLAEKYAIANGIKYVHATMIYSPDGRTMMVDDTEREIHLESGLWYSHPVKTMYSKDGKTKIIRREETEEYKKNGWYENMGDVGVIMFSFDGRSKFVFSKDVEANRKVGWYTAGGLIEQAYKECSSAIGANWFLTANYQILEGNKYSSKLQKDFKSSWYKNQGKPLIVVERTINENDRTVGYIDVINISDKKIIAFAGYAIYLDIYNDNIYELDFDEDYSLDPGMTLKFKCDSYRKMSGFLPVIQKVAFSDGTVWKSN